jgi:hypothetical protein
MLTVRLVPHWGDDDAPCREHFKGGELRLGLTGETIADPER